MKISGLTRKSLKSIGIVCLLIFGACILIVAISIQSGMKSQIEENIQTQVSLTATQVNTFFTKYETIAENFNNNSVNRSAVKESIAADIEFINHARGKDMMAQLTSTANSDDQIMAYYITSEINNDLLMSGDVWLSKDAAGTIVGERPWYRDCKNAKALIVCNPYVDAITGKVVTTEAVPMMEGDKVIGVTAFDITLDSVNSILKECSIGNDSEVVTLLPDGTVFYSTSPADKEGTYTPVEEMSQDLAAYCNNPEATGIVEYKHNGKTYLGAKEAIGKTGWVVFASINKSEAYSAVTSCTLRLAAMLLLAWLVTCTLVSFAFNKLAVKPVNALKEKADMMANGVVDLDIQRYERPSDEIQYMTNSLCDVLDNSKNQAVALEAVAAGNMVDIDVRSDKDIVNLSLQKVIDTLRGVDGEIERVSDALAEGTASVRAEDKDFRGMFRKLLGSVNGVINNIMTPLKKIADSVDSLGKGELLTIENDQKGDFETILNDIQVSINNVKALVHDTEELANAALTGDLNKRAEEGKHSGEFRNVVSGINKTLDMVIEKSGWYEDIINAVDAPIVVSNLDGSVALLNTAFNNSALKGSHADVVEMFKQGTTTSQVEAGGEIFIQKTMEIKNILGEVMGYVTSLNEVTAIQKPAAYSAKEIERLQGNLAKMAAGDFSFDTNREEPDKYCEAVARQYGMIEDSINKVAASVSGLVKDSRAMAEAAERGNLSYRVDATVHEGEYREVVEGLNNTVNLLLNPVEEAVNVLEQMAIGNLDAHMEGIYAGDHNKIKAALNGTLKNLRGTIQEIDRVLGAMAGYNFAINVNSAEFIGDFGTIGISLSNIIASIGGAIKEINDASVQVSGGSRQLSTAAQNLADGSTKQASSIEEITNAMKEIASVTESNTKDAATASEMSNNVMNNAKAGNAKMRDMLESMNQINEASASISKVIKVIDDIAFQTNILALNAAVEAARAGIHGKGFAVVADEVRNLAAKSASAVKDTTALIEGSIAKAEQGTVIANEAAAAFAEIVNGITETSHLCDAISEVSMSQESNVVNVNGAIENVSGVIQSNSATAEESAAQSEELYAQSSRLSELVARFKIAGVSNLKLSEKADSVSATVKDTETSVRSIELSGLENMDFKGSDKY